jgi:F0F1-type ATP synthase membrane subunit b/b'
MAKISVALCALGLAFAAASVAARPVDNVSHARHPNIAAAQHLSTQAYEKIVAAQRANEFDLGGHAQKAKDLLEQANRELKEAAETSNEHGH